MFEFDFVFLNKKLQVSCMFQDLGDFRIFEIL